MELFCEFPKCEKQKCDNDPLNTSFTKILEKQGIVFSPAAYDEKLMQNINELNVLANFTGKHLRWSVFSIKLQT